MTDQDTRAHRLAAALDEFIRSSPDVEAAAVVSFDGLPMASALPEELEEDRVGAMSAALLSLGEQAALGLGRGLLNQVFVEGEHGFVFLMSARDQAVLAAIASRNAKIGFMLFEMRRAADRIGRALESGAPEVVAPEADVAVRADAPPSWVADPPASDVTAEVPTVPAPPAPPAPYATAADERSAEAHVAPPAPARADDQDADDRRPALDTGTSMPHLGLVDRYDPGRATGA